MCLSLSSPSRINGFPSPSIDDWGSNKLNFNIVKAIWHFPVHLNGSLSSELNKGLYKKREVLDKLDSAWKSMYIFCSCRCLHIGDFVQIRFHTIVTRNIPKKCLLILLVANPHFEGFNLRFAHLSPVKFQNKQLWCPSKV